MSTKQTRKFYGYLLLLGSILLFACQQSTHLDGYEVAYFAPKNGGEEIVTPEKFSESRVMKIGITSSWQAIADLQAQGQLRAVIIHYSMVDKVDAGQLADWFANDNVVVAGIGIKGDELAELVGDAAFYPGPWLRPEQYETPDFFYIYQNQKGEHMAGSAIASDSFQFADANADYMLATLAGMME
ncbi:MAG: hypothetical protein KDE56_21445 [Anaerolineales bacterium]|nr:hypothetical protein [Anaerolineales bacterium]